MRILHIGGNDKFLPPFIKLVKENFNFKQHEFLLYSGMGEEMSYPNVTIFQRTIKDRLEYYLLSLFKMHNAEKIILHGLFDMKLVFILFFTPWLLKKCYWVMWGGDLYVYKLGVRNKHWYRNEFFRRFVIKRIGHLITYIKGDMKLAREWYGATGKYHECIMYTSNLYKEYCIPVKHNKTINIQVGNSADPSNNHEEALEKLLSYKDKDIAIYVPLSYGDKEHAIKIIKMGEKLFGDKFKPLTELMPFERYLEYLGTIDIAIFNHKRQQAMGNTITLLGLGKTVYLQRETSQWQLFQDKQIVIGDVDEFDDLELIDIKNNKKIVKEYFSTENFLNQLKGIFNGLSD